MKRGDKAIVISTAGHYFQLGEIVVVEDSAIYHYIRCKGRTLKGRNYIYNDTQYVKSMCLTPLIEKL